MKILFVASDVSALGGIQQYNQKFIQALKNKGDNVALIEFKGDIFRKAVTLVRAIIKSIVWGPRVTVCAHVNYAFFGLLMKKLFGRKYIVCTHGIDAWIIKGVIKHIALREASVITTVAEYTRNKIIQQIPELKNRIYFLYNPIDGSVFYPEAKKTELILRYGLDHKKVILTVARLSATEGYKGYDRVIQAMPKILEQIPSAVYLLVGDGDDAPRVREIIEKMRLENVVLVVGAIPNEGLVDYYNLADVFTMPSKAEGAPAVYVEALACGIPVIAGNKDGSSTPLQGGETGLLIDPESVEEIADAVVRVLTGNVDARLLDTAFLRQKTLEKFDIERFPERVNDVMKLALKD